MDFIKTLPLSDGYDAILVIVDRLSKQGIFIPTFTNCTSEDLAKHFVLHVFSKHGVPNHVTSDRGSEFISKFFCSLGKALDMCLHFTSGYHPKGDGQTKWVNQTLEQYLRIYCNYQQDNWSLLLPLAEFTYNNTPNESTGTSPFFANKGYHPNITVHPERELASAWARTFVTDLDQLHQDLRENLADAQKRYQIPADSWRKPPPDFQLSQEIFVRSKYIKTTRPSKKLSDKYLGPYKIVAKVGPQSYTLELPQSMKQVHPVFHVSVLEPSTPNTIQNRIPEPPQPVVIEGEEEWEIESIVDSKIDKRYRCSLRYYVKWFGCPGHPEEFQWLGDDDLDHARKAIEEFHRTNPTKPRPISTISW